MTVSKSYKLNIVRMEILLNKKTRRNFYIYTLMFKKETQNEISYNEL